jgi:hypothetical protein
VQLRAVFSLAFVTLFVSGILPGEMPPASTVQAQQQCGVDFDFQDQNGLVVIEIESAAAVGDWASDTALPDFTGSAYYRWDGGNNFGTPNIDTLEYQVRINTPGKYRFIWRTRITEGDNPTEGNDAWLKLPDASAFYGEKGDGSVVYPRDNGQGPGGADGREPAALFSASPASGWQRAVPNCVMFPVFDPPVRQLCSERCLSISDIVPHYLVLCAPAASSPTAPVSRSPARA